MNTNTKKEYFKLALKLKRLGTLVEKESFTRGEYLEVTETLQGKEAFVDKFYELMVRDDLPENVTADVVERNLDEFVSFCFELEAKIEDSPQLSRAPSKNSVRPSSPLMDNSTSVVGRISSSPVEEAVEQALSRALSTLNFNQKPSSNISNIRLPKITIPRFQATSLEEWSNFKSLFVSLVVENCELDNVQKLHYLRTSLSKEPLNLIASLPLQGENFVVACDTLVSRYDQPRAIAAAHWANIVNFPPVCKEATSMSNLICTVKTNMNALKAVGLPIEEWSFVTVFTVLQKVDPSIREAFERSHNDRFPSFETLMTFLEKTVNAMKTSDFYKDSKASSGSTYSQKSGSPKFKKESRSLVADSKTSCICCRQPHQHELYLCKKFISLKPFDRYKLVKRDGFCLRCLKPSHSISSCDAQNLCQSCGARHHSLLHYSSQNRSKECAPSDKPSSSSSSKDSIVTSSSLLARDMPCSSYNVILLSTALVDVHVNGQVRTCRALLDTGSQNSFILNRIVDEMNISKCHTNVLVSGMTNKKVAAVKHCVELAFSAVGRRDPCCRARTLCIDRICGTLPSTSLMVKLWDHVVPLPLADPGFAIPGEIELLLGADVLHRIFLKGRRSGPPGTPSAFETEFGWVLVGPARAQVSLCTMEEENSSPNAEHVQSLHATLEDMVTSFWNLEQVPESRFPTLEDKLCEEQFVETTTRNSEGRFVVKLPFKPGEPQLGTSNAIATRRFLNLESRLGKNKRLGEEYSAVIQQHLAEGHIEKTPPEEIGSHGYFLPHHCVVKEESESTRLRVVFDGSCKTTNGRSLNDTLMAGSKLHNDLVQILIQFRMHPIALSGDIRKMFCQIKVDPSDRQYQKILWRFSPTDPIDCYQFTTVVFGLTCSPFLAMRTILRLVEEEGEAYPQASQTIKNHVFVDDIITCCKDEASAIQLFKDITELLHNGGFEVRKWMSNSERVLDSIPPEFRRSQTSLSFEEDNSTFKVLGLLWDVQADSFRFNIVNITPTSTKRGVLSSIAKIFDPLGFLGPAVLLAKLILKDLWARQLDWDTPLPEDLAEIWSRFVDQLPDLSKISISRPFLHSSDGMTKYYLHAFGDASERAYGCVVYLVEVSPNHVEPYLIVAKTRVTPSKPQVTLPRLELQAALLSSKLVKFCVKVFANVNLSGIFCWTDSTVALNWIKSTATLWQTFVANRVSAIQENTDLSWWFYIRSEDNPADVASRGIEPSELPSCRQWWKGPQWLSSPSSSWPCKVDMPPIVSEEVEKEKKASVVKVLSSHSEPSKSYLWPLLMKHSSLLLLQKVTAYLFRGVTPSTSRVKGPLTTVELAKSLKFWVKQVQIQDLSELIGSLKAGKEVPVKFARLTPYLDSEGIVRVGGRLSLPHHNEVDHHPVLLPSKSRLTQLIVEFYHDSFGHLGLHALLSSLQSRFWIISARRVIRTIIFRCMTCYRLRPKFAESQMSNLPPSRIETPCRAFQRVGIDYCGPFIVKSSNLRKAPRLKAYIAVFTCMASRATHLEFVSDLSAPGFMAAFDRFVGRRGLPSDIYSDNGSNFRGAEREIRQFFNQKENTDILFDRLAARQIQWHFNPPAAPHFGGVWESVVKLVKTHLVRIVGQMVFTFEEFATILVRVEAALNSRPITAVSSDPNDFSALTPGHFLIFQPLIALPFPDQQEIAPNRLKRWEMVQHIHQRFWKRWNKEYIASLQSRQKWTKKSPTLEPGTLVIVKEDDAPPLSWKLGRILKVFPSRDGQVRVAVVRIPELVDGVLQIKKFKRPTHKLAPLPLSC